MLNALYVAWHTKKSWAFSDLVAVISVTLHESFVRTKLTLTVFLSFCYIECDLFAVFIKILFDNWRRQVILVSGYLVLTAVNLSQHWSPICVSVFLCSDPKLARKYEIEHWSRSSKTINWSADSFQINHVTTISWHMSPRYGRGILVSGYPVLTAVNWPYCESPK